MSSCFSSFFRFGRTISYISTIIPDINHEIGESFILNGDIEKKAQIATENICSLSKVTLFCIAKQSQIPIKRNIISDMEVREIADFPAENDGGGNQNKSKIKNILLSWVTDGNNNMPWRLN